MVGFGCLILLARHQTWVGECGGDGEEKGRIAHETVQQTCQLQLHVFSGDFVNECKQKTKFNDIHLYFGVNYLETRTKCVC